MRKAFFTILFLFCCKVSSAAQTPELNHLYVVLDSASFQALKTNPYMRFFGRMDAGMPDFSPVTDSSTTLYLRGKNTYVEIMGPENRFKEAVGAVGIGFSWDSRAGEPDTISLQRRSGNCPAFEHSVAKWNFGGKEIRWYTAYHSEPAGDIATWYAFYNPDFLTQLFGRPYTRFTRGLFLEKTYDASKDFTDVGGIVLSCSEADFVRINRELNCLGAQLIRKNGNLSVFRLGDVQFTLERGAAGKPALKKIMLRAKKHQNAAFTLGTLQVGGENQVLNIEFHTHEQ
ncbi:MAG: hypothetical protein INR69_11170 [Mucilaginibacter polytrichastri]|nr:hypothetical protein [Mucilaginibacter polytrichastri]